MGTHCRGLTGELEGQLAGVLLDLYSQKELQDGKQVMSTVRMETKVPHPVSRSVSL